MSDPNQNAIILGTFALINLVVAFFIKRIGDKVDTSRAETNNKIDVLKEQTDGISSKLNVAVAGEAGAVGELKGRADARVEAKQDKEDHP